MKRFLTFFFLISVLLIFSCQDNSKNDESVKDAKNIVSKYDDLEDYKWLSDQKNLSDETYREKFDEHFNQSLKQNKFEDAAAYLIAFGGAVRFSGGFDSIFSNTAIEFYKDKEDKISGEAKTNLSYLLGIQFHNLNKLDKSFEWLNKSISFETESDAHKQVKGFSHFAIAQNYLKQRELADTEKHLVEALRIFEEVGDHKNQGTAYLLMHSLYVKNRFYDQAEEILKKSIDIFKREKSDFLTFAAQIAHVHFHIEQEDTLKTIEQIDTLAIYAKHYEGISEYHKGILNQLLAFKHIAQKNEDSATHYLKISKEISDRTGIPDLKMRTFFQELVFANKFKKPLENPEEVEEFYNEMMMEEAPNTQFLFQMASALYTFYQDSGNYKKANEYSQFMIEDVRKQSKDRLEDQLFELQIKFETEQKEKTILLQEKKLAKTNKLIIILVASFALVVLLLLLLFVWSKNKSITKQKEMAENFSSQLLLKTEEERKRIASDLHDSVSNELVNLRHAIENSHVHLKNKIDIILEEVRNVSRNISPILFDKIGLKSSVEQLTERIQNQHHFFINSEIEYSGGLENNKELQLYRIIQEAITNILKHANAVAGKVTITEDDKNVYVEIKDNGKGFDVDKMLEKGNCFGLLNITERTKYLNGTVNFHSDANGTIIKILIPKY